VQQESLTERDVQRYGRQMMVRGFGEEGQLKLKRARALVAGAGGLGSPIATYLAAAGFGHITLADMDVVDLTNLNRQTLHWDKDVGRSKTESGLEKLRGFNPDVEVTAFEGRIDESNVLELAQGHDLILDAMDNFPTRYLLNDASQRLGIPFIHGSVWGLEGRATTIVPGRTPCLRCIFPEAPPKEKFPVLGTAPGIIGSIQAMEAVKLIVGIGRTLENRLLILDGDYMEFTELKIERNPKCRGCGGAR